MTSHWSIQQSSTGRGDLFVFPHKAILYRFQTNRRRDDHKLISPLTSWEPKVSGSCQPELQRDSRSGSSGSQLAHRPARLRWPEAGAQHKQDSEGLNSSQSLPSKQRKTQHQYGKGKWELKQQGKERCSTNLPWGSLHVRGARKSPHTGPAEVKLARLFGGGHSVGTPCCWNWPWLGSRRPHIRFQEVQALVGCWGGPPAFTKYLSRTVGSFAQRTSASTSVAGLASGSVQSGSLLLLFPLPVQHRGVHGRWWQGAGLDEEGRDAPEDNPDILGGVPPPWRWFPVLGTEVEDGSLNIPLYVDVGVPHFGQKPKGRKGEKTVDGELEACLEVATLSWYWGGQRWPPLSCTPSTKRSPRNPRPSAAPEGSCAFCELDTSSLSRKLLIFTMQGGRTADQYF